MVQTVWSVRNERKEKPARSPEDSEGLSPLLLKLLLHRGLETREASHDFLYPDRKNLHPPHLMKGMREAVERLRKAQAKQEKVLVHGDYDVDGITGSAILSLALEKLKIPHETFLPERAKDGYGVNRQAIERAGRGGVKLLVTVDCGISAGRQIGEAKKAGIESIVVDHHRLPPEGVPPAHAILNPLQEDCPYPFKELSAGGLAFKFAQALLGAEAFDYFDLATLSTIADLAPLKGENRILVQEGLRQLSERKRVGIRALAQTASLRAQEIKASHVGFVLGPRINASGRMSSARTALQLLLTRNVREAESLAEILELENRQRQQVERRVLSEAIQQVEQTVNFSRERILVVAHDGWHVGVIGIVAARLVERFHRPALVIALQDGKGKGSGRSIRSFHLFNALEAARGSLVEFGGHEQAAGFVAEREQIGELRRKLNEYAHATYPAETFLKSINIDLEISLEDLAPRFLRELQLLEPYGMGNPKPLFLTRKLFVKKVLPGVKGGRSRPRIWVTDGTLTYEAAASERNPIAFDWRENAPLDLVYSVDLRRWGGEEMLVLEVKDAKPSS